MDACGALPVSETFRRALGESMWVEKFSDIHTSVEREVLALEHAAMEPPRRGARERAHARRAVGRAASGGAGGGGRRGSRRHLLGAGGKKHMRAYIRRQKVFSS